MAKSDKEKRKILQDKFNIAFMLLFPESKEKEIESVAKHLLENDFVNWYKAHTSTSPLHELPQELFNTQFAEYVIRRHCEIDSFYHELYKE